MVRALVCGAGIGGLSTAVHLEQAGFDATVFEMHPKLRTAGVGLNIWPNGVRVIRGLGLGDEYRDASAVMNFSRSLNSSGEMTSNNDVSDWEDRHGAPLTGAHRRRLNDLLAARIGQDNLRFDHAAVGYEQDSESVTVHFANGESAVGDVLIGADGIGSEIRNFMLGGEPEFTTDNLLRWRGVFSCAEAGIEDDIQCDVIGDIAHFGWIPIGGGDAYWFASSPGLDKLDDFVAYFNAWTDTPVPSLIKVTPPETIINSKLVGYKQHLKSWIDGRVALLGDAAHPMLPGMAQGANQALEDAEAIARHLSANEEVRVALKQYEAERIPLANRMVEYSQILFDFKGSHAAYANTHENQVLERFAQFESLRPGGVRR